MKKDLKGKNMSIISIHQPNYLPAYSLFNKISKSDIFIFLDDVRYQKQGWQNRNKIQTKNGNIIWLSVPIKNNFGQKINEVEISNNKWRRKHISTIEQTFNCKNTINWKLLKKIILDEEYTKLSDLNRRLIKTISYYIFKFKTMFVKSSDLKIKTKDPDERIIQIVKKFKGNTYIAGQGGKNYMDLSKYKKQFRVVFQDYKEKEPILSVLHKIL